MKPLPILAAALCLAAGTFPAHSQTLDFFPGPMDTGGMMMPMVSFNTETKSVSIGLMGQSTTLSAYSLQLWEVDGGTPFANTVFNPSMSAAPWYDLLDPTQQNLPFSTTLGFMTHGAMNLPEGSVVYIRAFDVSSGLNGYGYGLYDDVHGAGQGSNTFLHMFGDGSLGDNLAPWGTQEYGVSMWHPLFVTDGEGTFLASFEIFLGDGFGNALDGWSSDTVTITWVAVPEPSTTLLLLGAAATAGLYLRKRRNIKAGS